MDKEKLDLYDKIINSCMINTYSLSEDGKIVLKDFNPNLKHYMFEFEIAKIVSSLYQNREIYIDMPFFKYLFFKIKNRKIKINRIKKDEAANRETSMDDMLRFVAKSYNVNFINFNIFSEIYDTYWNRKENN